MIIDINDVKYNVKLLGQGEPIWFLLHGFMGSLHDFDKIAPHLPGTVLVPDLLGHGLSTSQIPSSRFTVIRQVKDLISLTSHFKISKLNLVGYSMGGRLALSLSLKYPQVISHLFLESSTAGIENKQARQLRQQHDSGLVKKLQTIPLKAFVKQWASQPLFNSQTKLPLDLQEQIELQRKNQDAQGLVGSLKSFGTGVMPNFWPQLSKCQIPITLICGFRDQKFRKITLKMAQRFPHVKRMVIPKAGHNVHLEKPQQYIAILRNNWHENYIN